MSKASKRRFCPAINGELPPAECGSGRNSRYRCPAECPYNPLAPQNYDQLLAIEDSLDPKALRWVCFEDPVRGAALVDRLAGARADSQAHAMHAAVVWHMFFERDTSGLTSAQRWEKAGFGGLSNDERVLFAAKMEMRVVLLEIRQVLDDERIEATDLLAGDGAPFQLLDRSSAASMVRFSTILGWAYPLAYFWRLSGTAIILKDLGPFGPEEVLAETVRHLGGPIETVATRRWLAEHFVGTEKSITATANERLRRMYLGLDATWSHAVYELRASYDECRAALDAEPDLEPAPLEASEREAGFKEVRTWFDDSAEARAQSLQQGRPLLGTILMKEGEWKIEASSGSRLDRLRRLFEGRLGQRVRFARERRDDLGTRMAASIPVANDPDLIPPRLLDNIEVPGFAISKMSYPVSGDPATMAETMRQNKWRTFPDEPVPMLGGRTPREASRDPKLRKRLIALMKIHVRGVDEENLRKGAASDINPLLRELGLHEIDFPPPPRRKVPGNEKEPEDEVDEEDIEDDPHLSGGSHGLCGPLLPPLPRSRPLSAEEAEDRFGAALDAFELAEEALDVIEATGSTLVDDLYMVTEGLISDQEFDMVVPFVISAWFALVPRDGPAPQIPSQLLRADIDRQIRSLGSDRGNWTLDHLLKEHRQPELAKLAMSQCLDAFSQFPKKIKPTPEEQAIILVVLCTVIDELDCVVRG